MSGNDNPGNFANRPTEEVQEIASKGGQASHSGGFASMDPDKQVCARRITTERTINWRDSLSSETLHQKAVKPRAVLLSQVARKLERQDGKVDKSLEETLPEYYTVTQ